MSAPSNVGATGDPILVEPSCTGARPPTWVGLPPLWVPNLDRSARVAPSGDCFLRNTAPATLLPAEQARQHITLPPPRRASSRAPPCSTRARRDRPRDRVATAGWGHAPSCAARQEFLESPYWNGACSGRAASWRPGSFNTARRVPCPPSLPNNRPPLCAWMYDR